jgi:hypothetical protein
MALGEGTVLSALLTFTGGGTAGAPGGSVGVIYDYVVRDGLTANEVPHGGSALNVHPLSSDERPHCWWPLLISDSDRVPQ